MLFQYTRDTEKTRLKREVPRMEQKLVKKNEVLSQLMAEQVGLRKELGQLDWHVAVPGNAGAGRSSGQRVVREWSEKAGIGVGRLITWFGISKSKYYDWRRRYGRAKGNGGRGRSKVLIRIGQTAISR